MSHNPYPNKYPKDRVYLNNVIHSAQNCTIDGIDNTIIQCKNIEIKTSGCFFVNCQDLYISEDCICYINNQKAKDGAMISFFLREILKEINL